MSQSQYCDVQAVNPRMTSLSLAAVFTATARIACCDMCRRDMVCKRLCYTCRG